MIIMDDGFQNPFIAKKLSLLVIDGATGFGNGRLIPAGPLREEMGPGFARADAIVIVNPTSEGLTITSQKPLLAAKTTSVGGAALKGKKIYAFCGLAYPEKFFTSLMALGADIVGTRDFADHHFYSDAELKKLSDDAAREQALLVTTAKDAVRLPEAFRSSVHTLDIELVFDKPELLAALLDYAMGRP